MRYRYSTLIFDQDPPREMHDRLDERDPWEQVDYLLDDHMGGESPPQWWPTWRAGAGSRDGCELVRHHGQTYLVIRNRALGYFGLELLVGTDWIDPTVAGYLNGLLQRAGLLGEFLAPELPRWVIDAATRDVAAYVKSVTTERITVTDLMSPARLGWHFALGRNGDLDWSVDGGVADRLTALAAATGPAEVRIEEGGSWRYEVAGKHAFRVTATVCYGHHYAATAYADTSEVSLETFLDSLHYTDGFDGFAPRRGDRDRIVEDLLDKGEASFGWINYALEESP